MNMQTNPHLPTVCLWPVSLPSCWTPAPYNIKHTVVVIRSYRNTTDWAERNTFAFVQKAITANTKGISSQVSGALNFYRPYPQSCTWGAGLYPASSLMQSPCEVWLSLCANGEAEGLELCLLLPTRSILQHPRISRSVTWCMFWTTSQSLQTFFDSKQWNKECGGVWSRNPLSLHLFLLQRAVKL